MRKVIFIRHGETTGDVEGRYGGAYDDRLSVRGEMQAKELCDELAEAGISKICCSDLIRAQQVAAALGARVGCAVEVRPLLRERNQYGALSGMLKSEALARFPAEVGQLKDRHFTFPGGESYEAFVARLREVVGEILGSSDGVVGVVWHGGGMRVLFREILQLGELAEIGDCAWVEVVQNGQVWEAGKMVRMTRAG